MVRITQLFKSINRNNFNKVYILKLLNVSVCIITILEESISIGNECFDKKPFNKIYSKKWVDFAWTLEIS